MVNASVKQPKHPRQPLIIDQHGTRRFKENKIVSYLMTLPGGDLNTLACMDFSTEDRRQFAQLIGYSESGYYSLSYAPRSR